MQEKDKLINKLQRINYYVDCLLNECDKDNA